MYVRIAGLVTAASTIFQSKVSEFRDVLKTILGLCAAQTRFEKVSRFAVCS